MPDAALPSLDKEMVLASDISPIRRVVVLGPLRPLPMPNDPAVYTPFQLLQDAGKPGTGEVIARLRCRRCGEPPHTVTMFNHHSGTAQKPVIEVMLLGKGDERWR